MGIPDTTIQRPNGTRNWQVGVDSSLKILESTGVIKMITIFPSIGPVELKKSPFTGFVDLKRISGDVKVIGNEGFDLSVIDNTGGVLIERNTLKSLKCSGNVPPPIVLDNAVTGEVTGQCVVGL